MKKLSAILLIIAMLFTAFSLTACGGTEIDLKSYTTVSFKGVDGDAEANIDFDFAAMEQAYSTANGSSDALSQKAMENAAKLSTFESTLDYSVTPEEGLSNGDEITVTFTYNESAAKEAGLSLKNTTYKMTVDGLKEPIVIDAFDPTVFNTDTGVMITYNGKAPEGYLTISNKVDKTNPVSKVTYKAESNEVAYGENFTITASLPSDAEEEGYVLKEETYEYPLKDVDHYLTSTDELTADGKSALKTKYETIIKGVRTSTFFYDADGRSHVYYNIKVSNPSLGELYLLKKNDGTYDDDAFVSVYVDITDTHEGTEYNNNISYYPVRNLYIKADGTLYFDASDSNSDFYANDDVAQKQFLHKYTDEFNIEKVSFE